MGYLTLCHQYLHSCPTLLCLIVLTPSCGLSVSSSWEKAWRAPGWLCPEDKEHRAWARQGAPQPPAPASFQRTKPLVRHHGKTPSWVRTGTRL